MLKGSWSTQLSEQIRAITLAELPDSAFVYQGHSNQLSVFMTNKTITMPIRKQVLQLGVLQRDKILLLTRYNLICYDFLKNEELFSIDFQNAHLLVVHDNLIYVACGSDIYAFSNQGEQLHANHLASEVMAVHCLSDSLVVATEDMSMGRYAQVNLVTDYGKVLGSVACLCWTGYGVVVGTKQGPVAYYLTKKAKWKSKSSHAVFSILMCPSLSPSSMLVTRTNGTVEIRNWEQGVLLSKLDKQHRVGQRIVGTFITDFRKQNMDQLICIGEGGTVRAYALMQEGEAQKKLVAAEMKNKNQEMEELVRTKAELQYEITQMKEALQQGANEDDAQENVDFGLKAMLEYENGLFLKLRCQNGYMSGLCFEQAIMPVVWERTQQKRYQFLGENDKTGEITCEVMIQKGLSSSIIEVKNVNIILPKFWKWGMDPKVRKTIEGRVRFKMIQRNARYLKWVKQCFFVSFSPQEEERLQTASNLRIRFYNWYDDQELELNFAPNESFVEIFCDCLKTMGQIVQDLVNYAGIKNLNSELTFPKQKERVKQMLNTVERLSQTKTSISSQIADAVNEIKVLLVRAESSRSVGSMKDFRYSYGEIMTQNRNLMAQTEKKNLNTQTLSQTLKAVGQFINQTANVRFGQPKTQMIGLCREAIRKKQFPKIVDLMERGVIQ